MFISCMLILPVDCILALVPEAILDTTYTLLRCRPHADPMPLLQAYLPTPSMFYAAIKIMNYNFPCIPWLSSPLHLTQAKAQNASPLPPRFSAHLQT